MASHYTGRYVTTQHDFRDVLGRPWTLSFGLSQFHDRGSWLMCETALNLPIQWPNWVVKFNLEVLAISTRTLLCQGRHILHGHLFSYQTILFQWYLIRYGCKNKHQIATCQKKIGLHAQSMLIIINSIMNTFGGGHGDLCDHSTSPRISTLIIDFIYLFIRVRSKNHKKFGYTMYWIW